VSWGSITWMLDLRKFVVVANATAIRTEVTRGPWSSVIVRQVDTTVVPWIAVSIEAPCRLNGDERGFGDVVGTVFEERARRLRAVLAAIKKGRDRGHAPWLAKFVENGATFTSSFFAKG